MGKSESSSRRRRIAAGMATAGDLVQIMRPVGDGTYQPQYVSKEVAQAFEAQQALLNSAPKITDEDQFRISEALGLGETEDGRAKCIPGLQYRGADGRCKARPADPFGNVNSAQPVTFSDGLTTKMYHNDRVITLPTLPGAFPGGTAFGGGFNGVGGGGGAAIGAGLERFGPIQSGRAVDPDDARVKSWRAGYPGAKWQTYERNFRGDCGPGNFPTPNGGCVTGQDMFKDGWQKALYGPRNQVVAQPYQTSFTDMTNLLDYQPYGQPRAAFVPPGDQPRPWNPQRGAAFAGP